MGENPILNKGFRIHLLFFTTAFNVGKPNGKRPQCLATQRYNNAGDNFPHLNEMIVKQGPCSLEKKHGKNQGEKGIPVPEKKVSCLVDHFTATIPQKLYHLKNTSQ